MPKQSMRFPSPSLPICKHSRIYLTLNKMLNLTLNTILPDIQIIMFRLKCLIKAISNNRFLSKLFYFIFIMYCKYCIRGVRECRSDTYRYCVFVVLWFQFLLCLHFNVVDFLLVFIYLFVDWDYYGKVVGFSEQYCLLQIYEYLKRKYLVLEWYF
jgi:hypothetical protein